MSRGGKRPGAGRPGDPSESRSLRLPAWLWLAIDLHAEHAGVPTSRLARQWLEASLRGANKEE